MNILCVDDDLDFCKTIDNQAKLMKVSMTFISSISQFKHAIANRTFTACVVNAKYFKPNLPPMNGSYSNSFPLEARKNKGAILDMAPLFSEPQVRASREKITSNMTAVIGGKLGFNEHSWQGTVSLIYHELPSIDKLKALKKMEQPCFVGGKPMCSQEAHYLLSKLCCISNQTCDWIDEIPKNLMNEFYRLSYDRLAHIAELIPKLKKNPSTQTWKELESIVHKIAGSAGMYGHDLASELCQKMEIYLKSQDYSTLDLDAFYRQLYLYLQ